MVTFMVGFFGKERRCTAWPVRDSASSLLARVFLEDRGTAQDYLNKLWRLTDDGENQGWIDPAVVAQE
eukprot:12935183-Prorocentrum_lima.AAC.1